METPETIPSAASHCLWALGRKKAICQLQWMGTCRGLWDSSLTVPLCLSRQSSLGVAHNWASCFLTLWPTVNHFCPKPVVVQERDPAGGGKAGTLSLQLPMAAAGKVVDCNRLCQSLSASHEQGWWTGPWCFIMREAKPMILHTNPSMINTYQGYPQASTTVKGLEASSHP